MELHEVSGWREELRSSHYHQGLSAPQLISEEKQQPVKKKNKIRKTFSWRRRDDDKESDNSSTCFHEIDKYATKPKESKTLRSLATTVVNYEFDENGFGVCNETDPNLFDLSRIPFNRTASVPQPPTLGEQGEAATNEPVATVDKDSSEEIATPSLRQVIEAQVQDQEVDKSLICSRLCPDPSMMTKRIESTNEPIYQRLHELEDVFRCSATDLNDEEQHRQSINAPRHTANENGKARKAVPGSSISDQIAFQISGVEAVMGVFGKHLLRRLQVCEKPPKRQFPPARPVRCNSQTNVVLMNIDSDRQQTDSGGGIVYASNEASEEQHQATSRQATSGKPQLSFRSTNGLIENIRKKLSKIQQTNRIQPDPSQWRKRDVGTRRNDCSKRFRVLQQRETRRSKTVESKSTSLHNVKSSIRTILDAARSVSEQDTTADADACRYAAARPRKLKLVRTRGKKMPIMLPVRPNPRPGALFTS